MQQWIFSWFYNLFHDKIENSLKKRLVSLLCDKAHDVDTKWNDKISSYPCKQEFIMLGPNIINS